jgi:predicted AlkP superfamily phosphohydrolase/phosphomutase
LVAFSYVEKDTENMKKLLAPNINEIINDVYEFVCYANKYVNNQQDPRDVMVELLRQCFDINELIDNRDDFEKVIQNYFTSMENEKEESESE